VWRRHVVLHLTSSVRIRPNSSSHRSSPHYTAGDPQGHVETWEKTLQVWTTSPRRWMSVGILRLVPILEPGRNGSPLVPNDPLRGGIVLYMVGSFAYWRRPDRATHNYSRHVRPRSVVLPPMQSASFAVFAWHLLKHGRAPNNPHRGGATFKELGSMSHRLRVSSTLEEHVHPCQALVYQHSSTMTAPRTCWRCRHCGVDTLKLGFGSPLVV
jgi:hypothetical protein